MTSKKLLKNLLPYGLISLLDRRKNLNEKNERKPPKTPLEFQQLFEKYASALSDNRFSCNWEDRYPCLNEATTETAFDPHYLYHPAWAARKLKDRMPVKHVDVSSSIYFVAFVSAFIKIDFYDFRPATLRLSGLNIGHADLINLHLQSESLESISCMHVVEHVGLGRYGDPINPKGDIIAITELKRVTKKGGYILFVVPIGGVAKIAFNAHRIYTYRMIVEAFHDCDLLDFSLVLDNGDFVSESNEETADSQTYGCACFQFVKR